MFTFLDSLLPGLGAIAAAIGQLFLVIFVLPIQLLIRLFSSRPNVTPKTTKSQINEAARQAGCRDVVLGFATHLGYIARECITREELEKLIDDGISPDDLRREIHARINEAPGILLGVHKYHSNQIKLPYSVRDRHAYIIGRTGSGKTNTLRQWIMQDIENGCGVGVIAPEAEMLTDEILPYIPDDRIDDVVYVNPADTEYPIPFNPFQLDEGENIDLRADDTVTIFKRLMGETGARMDEILRQTCYALLERPESTLLDIERLLSRTDDSFRREIINTTSDEDTAYFFEETYPSYPKDAHLPITTRIGRLTRPKVVRTLLCQPRSFNFREAMDEGKILLFNLSDGLLGEQTAQLLGQLIVAKIQTAVFSRADVGKAERPPFYLYLDEFQNFVGVNAESYSRLLSRSRKYAFGLILANQQTAQISSDLLHDILGNVSTLLCFNVSHADATKIHKEFLIPMGDEPVNVPDYELQTLKTGEAWGKINGTVFPLQTALADQNPNPVRAKEVIERSRVNYGFVSDTPVTRKRRVQIPTQPETPEKPTDATKIF